MYEVVSSAGKTWTVQHVQNNAAADSTTLNTAGTNILTPFSLPITAPSYKTSTPWSGGHLNVSCNADGNRPALRCMMLSRTAHAALWDAIKGTAPVQDLQIRTAAATGAIGVNDLAQTVHKCSWYQGGNVSGGMSQAGVAHALTSAGYTKAFDGLIWVHNDAQSGSTWGTNVYQVAVRCSVQSGATNVTLRLTVDGQTATATKAAASGENYLLFEPSVASIDITKYAVACAAELTVDTSEPSPCTVSKSAAAGRHIRGDIMAQTALVTYTPTGLGLALYKDTLPALPSGKTTWGVATLTTKVGDIPTNTSGTFKRTVIQAAGGSPGIRSSWTARPASRPWYPSWPLTSRRCRSRPAKGGLSWPT